MCPKTNTLRYLISIKIIQDMLVWIRYWKTKSVCTRNFLVCQNSVHLGVFTILNYHKHAIPFLLFLFWHLLIISNLFHNLSANCFTTFQSNSTTNKWYLTSDRTLSLGIRVMFTSQNETLQTPFRLQSNTNLKMCQSIVQTLLKWQMLLLSQNNWSVSTPRIWRILFFLLFL